MVTSENSVIFATIAIVLSVAMILLYACEKKRRRKAHAKVYRKLSKSDRQIIDVVRETEKQAISTVDNITTTYQKTMQNSIEREQLL